MARSGSTQYLGKFCKGPKKKKKAWEGEVRSRAIGGGKNTKEEGVAHGCGNGGGSLKYNSALKKRVNKKSVTRGRGGRHGTGLEIRGKDFLGKRNKRGGRGVPKKNRRVGVGNSKSSLTIC